MQLAKQFKSNVTTNLSVPQIKSERNRDFTSNGAEDAHGKEPSNFEIQKLAANPDPMS
jgi:hypothetical protein